MLIDNENEGDIITNESLFAIKKGKKRYIKSNRHNSWFCAEYPKGMFHYNIAGNPIRKIYKFFVFDELLSFLSKGNTIRPNGNNYRMFIRENELIKSSDKLEDYSFNQRN